MSGFECELRIVRQQIEREKAIRHIRKNRYDNWYGYMGCRRAIMFVNTSTETAEEQAQNWLANKPNLT